MPGDRLAPDFTVVIGGRLYTNGADSGSRQQPMRLEIAHRDQQASRLTLTVFDAWPPAAGGGDSPFPEFNQTPNPRLVEGVPVEAWGGWEEESLVKMFAGFLVGKEVDYQPSTTEFTAIHDARFLRKRARVHALTGLTVKEMLVKKGRDENIDVQFDPSAAGDPYLNTPVEWFGQLGEAPWPLMLRYLVAAGFITNTIRKNVLVVRRDKTAGRRIEVRRGDEQIVALRVREEDRRAERSARIKGHAHENKPGRHWSRQDGQDTSRARAVQPVPPPIGKKDSQHKTPITRLAQQGRTKRREIEGDELFLTLRLRPEMRNEEILVVQDFGQQVDGEWQTRSVTHKLGGGPSQTVIECWRP